MQHRARKRFGQNFLQDANVIEGIVRAIAPGENDHLIEIGPGLGALTQHLIGRSWRLDVIELDRDLVAKLQALDPALRIHNSDALKFDYRTLYDGEHKLRLIGNLPYNISSPLIFHLLDQAEIIHDMHFMLQKEVVERMAASPGGGDYGRLSIMVQYRCKVDMLFTVGPEAFRPAPKVESAIVRLMPYAQAPFPAQDEKVFAAMVNQAFSQRRKTLRNALKNFIDAAGMQAAGIDPAARPETLSVEQFVRLANNAA